MAGGAAGVAGGSPVFGAKPGGGGAGGAKFLAPIYAAGLADNPTADNMFAMPSGNATFYGQTGSGQTPAFGFWENAPPGTFGDIRVGSDIFRRYYALGVSAPANYDWFLGWDPAWDGTNSSLNGVQIYGTTVGFTKSAAEDGNPMALGSGITLGQQLWWNVGGFFEGPGNYPTPGFNSGQREDVWFRLWNNNGGGGINLRGGINGYGQFMNFPQPNNTGMTAALDTTIVPDFQPSAPGTGIGWLIRYGSIGLPLPDPPKGTFGLVMTTNNGFADPWQWRWDAQNSGSGSIANLMTLDSVNGLVVQGRITSAGSASMQAFESAELDLTALSSGNVIAPAILGRTFCPVRVQFLTTQVAGALSTPATLDVAVGAGVFFGPSSGLTNATQFGFGVGGLVQSSPTQATSALGTACTTDVSVAATGTGGFVFKGKVIVTGYYA